MGHPPTAIMDWFADNSQPLKRLTFILDEEPVTGHLRFTLIRAHCSRDLLEIVDYERA